jgi:hypothetical protein
MMYTVNAEDFSGIIVTSLTFESFDEAETYRQNLEDSGEYALVSLSEE